MSLSQYNIVYTSTTERNSYVVITVDRYFLCLLRLVCICRITQFLPTNSCFLCSPSHYLLRSYSYCSLTRYYVWDYRRFSWKESIMGYTRT